MFTKAEPDKGHTYPTQTDQILSVAQLRYCLRYFLMKEV